MLSDELGNIRSRLSNLGGGRVGAPPGLGERDVVRSIQSPLLGASPVVASSPEAAAQARALLGRGTGRPGAPELPAAGGGSVTGY